MIRGIKLFLTFLLITILAMAGGHIYHELIKEPSAKMPEKQAVKKSPVLQHAISYKLLTQEDFSTHSPYRKRVKWYIYADAKTKDQRAHTAIKAALDCRKQTAADLIDIRLTPIKNPNLKQADFQVAWVQYAADGQGFYSKQTSGPWEIKVSDLNFTPKHLSAADAMLDARFMGMDKIDEVINLIAQPPNITRTQAEKLWADLAGLFANLQPYHTDHINLAALEK
jgi:hypothetical protein